MNFDRICAELEPIIQASGEALEGNCVYYHQTLTRFPELSNKQQNLRTVAAYNNKPGSKICEIGFNAGHSAALFLLNAPDAEFTFFDLGEHAYTRPCFKYIDSAFPTTKKTMVYGDSRTIIPSWLSTHKDAIASFDVVHVDGGHLVDCVVSDLAMSILMVRKGGIVIVDDTNSELISSYFEMWERAGIIEKMPQLETPNNTYAHIVARRTNKDF